MFFNILIILGCILIIINIIWFIAYKQTISEHVDNKRTLEHISITSETVDGIAVDNNVFKNNKVTMVNLWSTYCPSCVKELSYLQEMYDDRKNQQVGMLGIIVDVEENYHKNQQLENARKILEKKQIEYPNVLLDNDLKDYVSNRVFKIPTTIFVDSTGKVIGDVIEMAHSKKYYKKMLENILSQIRN